MRLSTRSCLVAVTVLLQGCSATIEVNMWGGSLWGSDRNSYSAVVAADKVNTVKVRVKADTIIDRLPEFRDNLPPTLVITNIRHGRAGSVDFPATFDATLVKKPDGTEGHAYEFTFPAAFVEGRDVVDLPCMTRMQFRATIDGTEATSVGWRPFYLKWHFPERMDPERYDLVVDRELSETFWLKKEFCYRPKQVRLVVQEKSAKPYCAELYRSEGKRELVQLLEDGGNKVVDVAFDEGSTEMRFLCVRSWKGVEQDVIIRWRRY